MRSTFEGFKEFAAEIERIEKAKVDLVVPMRRVAMLDPDHVELAFKDEAQTFGITENGHRQLAEKVGIPFDY